MEMKYAHVPLHPARQVQGQRKLPTFVYKRVAGFSRLIQWGALSLILTFAPTFAHSSNSATATPNGARNESLAFHEYWSAAASGNPEAQIRLGAMYETGQSAPRNEDEAENWYRKAADQGHPVAQNALGILLMSRSSSEPKLKAAVALLQKSAAQGYAAGQYNLAAAYQHGLGVPRNELTAIKWFRKAAEQDDTAAFFWVGRALEKGIGTSPDEAAAVVWYRKGAARGDAPAQNALAAMYATGRGGLPHSVADMLEWFGRAADQGYGLAMHNLGRIHEKGIGVPVDYDKAYVWFNLAAATGVDESHAARIRLEKGMSPEQIAQAHRHSRQWRPHRGPGFSATGPAND